jgi:hypothetical protein
MLSWLMNAHIFVFIIFALLTHSVEGLSLSLSTRNASATTTITTTTIVDAPAFADTGRTSLVATNTSTTATATLRNHGANIFATAKVDAGVSAIPSMVGNLQVFQNLASLTALTCVNYDQFINTQTQELTE